MKRYIIILAVLFPCIFFRQNIYAQEKIIQLYGVVRGGDSTDALPGASVYVHGTNRGTIANDMGIFSIAVSPGEKIDFSFIGFKDKIIEIPANIKGDQYMISPILEQDTAFLPTAIVNPLPLPALFKIIFLKTNVPDDHYAIALQNVNVKNMLRQMRHYRLTGPGAINMLHQQQAIQQGAQKGLLPSTGIINPLSWYDFVKSLKEGKESDNGNF
ncbi:MAG: carboxypeptidase-like regulatory domain-containing protein [Arachidicoccus sp.]|nr:carboxypeptidase-like regulatory domain-containing protein [Arachidicoccus sp.]